MAEERFINFNNESSASEMLSDIALLDCTRNFSSDLLVNVFAQFVAYNKPSFNHNVIGGFICIHAIGKIWENDSG